MAGSKLGASPVRVVCRAGGARLQLWRAPGSPRSDHEQQNAHGKRELSEVALLGPLLRSVTTSPHLSHFRLGPTHHFQG